MSFPSPTAMPFGEHKAGAVARALTRKRRRAPPADIPVKNGILAALLTTEYRRLLPKLEHVALKRGQIVYRADQEIREVYFPEEAVIAMVDATDDSRTVEVGIIGRDESIAAMLGVRRSSITQAARTLQAGALISYRRGRISVLDKPGLGKQSCECYRLIRQGYARLHGELPRLLAGK